MWSNCVHNYIKCKENKKVNKREFVRLDENTKSSKHIFSTGDKV